MYTLSLIFNKDVTKVLMCDHQKFHALNYIGGKINLSEDPMNASYRELEEETGIGPKDVLLYWVRTDRISYPINKYEDDYDMFITAGVLCHDHITLREEKNKLQWISIFDIDTILRKTKGNGNCVTYLIESLEILDLVQLPHIRDKLIHCESE